jgi:hypothetical protein
MPQLHQAARPYPTLGPALHRCGACPTEAEHRSTFYIPYWNVPLLRALVPRQRAFAADMVVINDCLDGLIRNARETRQEEDLEALQARDYSQVRVQLGWAPGLGFGRVRQLLRTLVGCVGWGLDRSPVAQR